MKRRFVFLALALGFALTQRAVNAQNFWRLTNAPNGDAVQALAANTQGYIFAGTAFGAVLRSTDNGENWAQANNGLTYRDVLSLACGKNGIVFAGTNSAGIFRSTDNGDNWTQVNAGLTNLVIRCLAINTNGHVFAGTSRNIMRSVNGITWDQVYATNVQTGDFIAALAINAGDSIFAGIASGGGGSIVRSTNNGGTWTKVFDGVVPNDRNNVSSFAINSRGHIFAGLAETQRYDGDVLRSTDGGNSWTRVATILSGFEVRSLAITDSGEIFAGTVTSQPTLSPPRGIFRSADNGDHWVQENSGLSDLVIKSLVVSPTELIFAGSNGGQIFRGDLATSIEETRGWPNPSTFTLEQNYPNPFNPSTSITFTLVKASQVKLIVYNHLGQQVATLVNGRLQVGTHSTVWETKNMPSGVYFYQLQTGGFIQSRKMVLTK